MINKPETKSTLLFTCTDDFFYFHAGYVYLFGKLVDGIVGVFVGERVDVHFDPWRNWIKKKSHSSHICRGNVTW